MSFTCGKPAVFSTNLLVACLIPFVRSIVRSILMNSQGWEAKKVCPAKTTIPRLRFRKVSLFQSCLALLRLGGVDGGGPTSIMLSEHLAVMGAAWVMNCNRQTDELILH